MFGLSLKKVIPQLVNRARDGDQNAMAYIRRTRDSAMAGSKKARRAYEMFMSYIHEHPIVTLHPQTIPVVSRSPTNDTVRGEAASALSTLSDNVSMTSPEARTWYMSPDNVALIFCLPMGGGAALMAGAVILADGPDLTDDRIEDLLSLVDDRYRLAFYNGINVGSKDRGSFLEKSLPPDGKRIFNAGRAVGTARSLQIVRKGGDLSHHNESMAWELG